MSSLFLKWRSKNGENWTAIRANNSKKKLIERLKNPHVPAARLSGQKDRYKIKLRSIGYRLLYEVRDDDLSVIVIAVGRRDRSFVYKAAEKR